MKLFGSLTELVATVFRKNSQTITLRPNQTTTYTAARDVQLPQQDANSILVSRDSTDTLTNKTISGASNTISNVSLTTGVTGILPTANGGTNQNSTATFPTSGVVVTEAATETLSNKTLDNTSTITVKDANFTIQDDADTSKQAKFQASGITTATTRTYTLPDATTTVVGTDATQTLTNKTISGSSNTLTVLAGTQLSGQVPIANGGTGQATANAGFNALSPLTTKGDLISYSTVNARLGVGSDGQVLTADSTQTLGVKWATSTSGSGADSPYDGQNYTLAFSVSSNALTVALKDKAGSDPSAGSPVNMSFRSSTANLANYAVRQTTAAVSFTISSGSTLGHRSAVEYPIYWYAVDNAGTVVLGASTSILDEGKLYSTTAEGGVGTASSPSALYTSSALSSKAIRLIGRSYSNQTTAGTWAVVPQKAQVLPVERQYQRWVDGGPIVLKGGSSDPTKGTISVDKVWWKQSGDSIVMRLEYKQTAAGSNGSGGYFVQLPTGLSIDLTKIVSTNGDFGVQNLGSCNARITAGPQSVGYCYYVDAGGGITGISLVLFPESGGGGANQFGSGYGGLGTNSDMRFAAFITVPVTEWA